MRYVEEIMTMNDEEAKGYRKWLETFEDEGWGYVPCSDCAVKGRRVPDKDLKRCRCLSYMRLTDAAVIALLRAPLPRVATTPRPTQRDSDRRVKAALRIGRKISLAQDGKDSNEGSPR